MADEAATDAAPALTPRRMLSLLILAAVIGVVAALAAWLLLEGIHQLEALLYDTVPDWLGYDTFPRWWPLLIVPLGAVFVAAAIVWLPGQGGHVPAEGLNAGTTLPIALPGVVIAAFGSIAFGAVLGPEAPLIALGGGLGLLALRLLGNGGPPELGQLLAACGMFSAVSLIFGSPIIAAVLMIEASGLGGDKLPRVLVPGLLAAGIGSLISIGLGSWTGLSTSDYAIDPLTLPAFDRPSAIDFVWAVGLALAVAVGCAVVLRSARALLPVFRSRRLVVIPLAGVVIAGLAIAFSYAADKPIDEVLFSGESSLPGLVASADTWSLGALALLLAFKGGAWAISLAGFRGGPTFPAMLLGAAAGIMASRLPGFDLTPAVAVGMGAAVAAVLRLPLSAVVLATMMTAKAGVGSSPLIIVGVVVAYVVTVALGRRAAAAAPVEQPAVATARTG